MTRAAVSDEATSIARRSRVHSSTIDSDFSVWPFAQRSNVKSYAQTWFGHVAANTRGPAAITVFRAITRVYPRSANA